MTDLEQIQVAMQTRQVGLEGTGEIKLRHLVKETLRMRPSRIVGLETSLAKVSRLRWTVEVQEQPVEPPLGDVTLLDYFRGL